MADYTYKFMVTIDDREQVVNRTKQNALESTAADDAATDEVRKEMERKNPKRMVSVQFIKKVRH
jgi:hypothetical protein